MQRYLFFFNYKVIILKKLCHLPNMVSHGKMKRVIFAWCHDSYLLIT